MYDTSEIPREILFSTGKFHEISYKTAISLRDNQSLQLFVAG